jgi:hypothetical protein|tara:strand:- start:240 stop:683 length:444 start_codon:yes stop_codon:yes gene_type:complete
MSEDGKKTEKQTEMNRRIQTSKSDKKDSSKAWANRQANGTFGPGNTIGNTWPAGVSGNPNGRRGASKDILDKIGSEKMENGTTRKERLLDRLYRMAEKGNIRAMAEVLDRTEGKSVERQVVASYKPVKIFDFSNQDQEEDPPESLDT